MGFEPGLPPLRVRHSTAEQPRSLASFIVCWMTIFVILMIDFCACDGQKLLKGGESQSNTVYIS